MVKKGYKIESVSGDDLDNFLKVFVNTAIHKWKINGANFDTKNVTKNGNSSLMLKDAFRTIQKCVDVLMNFGNIFAIFSHCASSISASILCFLIDYWKI